MSDLTFRTNMNWDLFGFLYIAAYEQQHSQINEIPSELKTRINGFVDGRGFDLNLVNPRCANQVLSVVFSYRSIDEEKYTINGAVVISEEKSEEHLARLAVKPKRALRETFAPLLETDLTLHAVLHLVRGKVMAKVKPMPNLKLIINEELDQ